jgi:hypothetical protein
MKNSVQLSNFEATTAKLGQYMHMYSADSVAPVFCARYVPIER